MNFLLNRSSEMGDEKDMNPITSVIIVADRNKCPSGFIPLTKTYDEQADADLWRESSFSFFNRPVRYLAVCRDAPKNTVEARVVTDLCVVRDSDPIPIGFIAIDFTADSKEKPLRKKYLCVRTVAREAVVDAVGEIILLSKLKKPPKNYSSAGEVDGVLICFKHIVIPPNFGVVMPRSHSSSTPIYPNLGEQFRHSAPALDDKSKAFNDFNALTIKSPVAKRGIEDVPFKLNPLVQMSANRDKFDSLPVLKEMDAERLDKEYGYYFNIERGMLSHS